MAVRGDVRRFVVVGGMRTLNPHAGHRQVDDPSGLLELVELSQGGDDALPWLLASYFIENR